VTRLISLSAAATHLLVDLLFGDRTPEVQVPGVEQQQQDSSLSDTRRRRRLRR
jgi:hypothetical protein